MSPGIGFGEYGDDHVRFALIENESRIRQAVRGIGYLEESDWYQSPLRDLAAVIALGVFLAGGPVWPLVLAIVAVTVALTFKDYGLGWDDYTQAEYGGLLLRGYASGFTDQRAFHFVNLFAYGGGFDLARDLKSAGMRVFMQAAQDIVIGARGHQPLDAMFFGSTTNHVVRRAACPVLTVKN